MAKNHSYIKELTAEWNAQTMTYKWLYVLYLILLCPLTLPFIRAIETRIGLSFFAPFSDAFIIIIVVAFCLSELIKKIKWMDLIFIIGVIAFYFYSLNKHTNTALIANESAPIFLWSCLPLYFVGLTIDNKTSAKLFIVLGYIAFVLNIIYISVLGFGQSSTGEERDELMSTSYALLPFVCLLLWNAYQRKDLSHYVIAIIALFFLLSLGTRGAVASLATFVAVYFVFFKKYKHDILVKCLIGLIGSILISFSSAISFGLAMVSQSLGLSTRVFDSMLVGEFSAYNSRDVIWEDTYTILKNNKILWDDHLFVDRLYNPFEEQYVHNLELELMCDFGLIGGSIIIVLLLWLIIRAYYRSWSYVNNTILLLTFFCSSIMQLQFSGSYIITPIFWFFIGMCVSSIRNRKQIRVIKNS